MDLINNIFYYKCYIFAYLILLLMEISHQPLSKTRNLFLLIKKTSNHVTPLNSSGTFNWIAVFILILAALLVNNWHLCWSSYRKHLRFSISNNNIFLMNHDPTITKFYAWFQRHNHTRLHYRLVPTHVRWPFC